MEDTQNPPIEAVSTISADVPVTVEDLAGVPDGTVLKSNTKDGVVAETVVQDVDADGNVIGWHKEIA